MKNSLRSYVAMTVLSAKAFLGSAKANRVKQKYTTDFPESISAHQDIFRGAMQTVFLCPMVYSQHHHALQWQTHNSPIAEVGLLNCLSVHLLNHPDVDLNPLYLFSNTDSAFYLTPGTTSLSNHDPSSSLLALAWFGILSIFFLSPLLKSLELELCSLFISLYSFHKPHI